jgi:hypothetical protein
MTETPSYRGMLSTDWSDCLSPTGPFNAITFNYPHLTNELQAVFKEYTGNRMTLGQAARRVEELLPEPLTAEQMDEYLRNGFVVYPGVPELIEWCGRRRILFMINTTAMIGYFQRVLANRLLPPIPVLSANPLIRFRPADTDPPSIHQLFETTDKAKNTEAAARRFGLSHDRIVVMGDSGGDGPHFQWAHQNGVKTIGSMTKSSLTSYCREHRLTIDHHFGPRYQTNEPIDRGDEMSRNFIDLTEVLDAWLGKD